MIHYAFQNAFVAPPATTGPVERWPRHDVGSQFRHGPTCLAYAATNAALGQKIAAADRVDPYDVFLGATDIDGVPQEDNVRLGTTGDAAMESLCQELVGAARWVRVPEEAIPSWLFHVGPLVVTLKWNYVHVGLIGSTLRRSPETFPTHHAVCLCGYEPFHRTGLGIFNPARRPCYLVLDSIRRGRTWLPSVDLHKSGDLMGAWGLVETKAETLKR